MPLFEVNVLHSFRMKYVIDAQSLEHAFDEVTMNQSGADKDAFDEISQKFLGDQIIDGREISTEEFVKICRNLQADKDELCAVHCESLIRKIDYNS